MVIYLIWRKILVEVAGIEVLTVVSRPTGVNGWVSFENWRDRLIDTEYFRPRERQRAFERIRTLERGVIRGVSRDGVGVEKSVHRCTYTLQFLLLIATVG